MSAAIDRVSFFDRLADEMNHHPEQYEALGELDLDLAVVMRDPHGDFAVRLTFGGTRCDGVGEIGDGDETTADCWLDGSKEAWQTMFDNIVANGHATGRQTINSLTLLADQISVHGDDPLGVDKFFRFNQTVQAFFDGAASVATSAGT